MLPSVYEEVQARTGCSKLQVESHQDVDRQIQLVANAILPKNLRSDGVGTDAEGNFRSQKVVLVQTMLLHTVAIDRRCQSPFC